VDEIESLPPRLGHGEEVGDMIGDLRVWKAAFRPVDGLADEVERCHMRARRAQAFGIVAKTAADIKGTQARDAAHLPADPRFGQGMRRKISPGHTSRIIIGEPIDGFEPFLPQRIGRLDTPGSGWIERIKDLACLGAARGELGRSGIEVFVQNMVFRKLRLQGQAK
jgi:hypothetical protein